MASGRRDVDDYSFSRPAMSALARGLMRYLYGNGKGLTSGEIAIIKANGKMLGLNYEAGAGDYIGASVGRSHASLSLAIASRLPVRRAPIIYSADWQVQISQYRAVGDAIEAGMALTGPGYIGIYGHYGLIEYLWSRFGNSIFYWQTYAWSGGRLSSHADLYQFLNGQNVAGGQVDFNQITGRNFLVALGGSLGQTIPSTNEEDDLSAEFEKATTADLAAKQKQIDALTEQLGYALRLAADTHRTQGETLGLRPRRKGADGKPLVPLAPGVEERNFRDTLRLGDKLQPGEELWSADGDDCLVMQEDGNLVLYNVVGKPKFESDTDGNPGAFCVMQPDGNLVVYSSTGRALWDSKTQNAGTVQVKLQEDGNVVWYRQDNTFTKATNTFG